MSKTAVVLLNFGGPDSLNSVRPFLYNIFSDRYVFSFPISFVFQKPLAWLIAKNRSHRVQREYALIGGSSPINKWTQKQRTLLQEKLRSVNPDIDIFIGMRFWYPFISDAAEQVMNSSYDKILLLPLYPQYSKTTTGSAVYEWNRVFKGDKEKVTVIPPFFNHPTYIQAVNQRISEAMELFPKDARNDVYCIFSAHSLPVSIVKAGDPYREQVESTITSVMELRGNDCEWALCYQSKVGFVEWLKPAVLDTITEAAAAGKKNILIIPVSFVSENIETLYELDIEYRYYAEKQGAENYFVAESLNDSPLFIQTLFELVSEHL